MAVLQEQKISPYLPDRTYNLGDNTGQFNDQDIGKAVKQSAANPYLQACGNGDNIMGIVSSVEPFTKDGHSQGAVACDLNAEMYAVDEAGTLARDTLVVSGAPNALGTLNPLARPGVYGPPVKAVTTETAPHLWVVIEVYGSGAGRGCLIRKVA